MRFWENVLEPKAMADLVSTIVEEQIHAEAYITR